MLTGGFQTAVWISRNTNTTSARIGIDGRTLTRKRKSRSNGRSRRYGREGGELSQGNCNTVCALFWLTLEALDMTHPLTTWHTFSHFVFAEQVKLTLSLTHVASTVHLPYPRVVSSPQRTITAPSTTNLGCLRLLNKLSIQLPFCIPAMCWVCIVELVHYIATYKTNFSGTAIPILSISSMYWALSLHTGQRM